MKALWTGLELLDRGAIKGLEKLEKLRGKTSFRARAEQSVEDIRPPQKAIQFDA